MISGIIKVEVKESVITRAKRSKLIKLPRPWLFRISQKPKLIIVLLHIVLKKIRSLRNEDDDGNENGKKAKGLDKHYKHCTCITLFCTFLFCRCTTTTWNCLISRFVEDGTKRQQLSFSFPNLWCSLELNSKNFAYIWRIKRDGISAIKFEATQIYFLSDVFDKHTVERNMFSVVVGNHALRAQPVNRKLTNP